MRINLQREVSSFKFQDNRLNKKIKEMKSYREFEVYQLSYGFVMKVHATRNP